jgi:hypothetical protein
VDDRFIAVGHGDGGLTVYDRLTSLQYAFPSLGLQEPSLLSNEVSQSAGNIKSKGMVVWIGKFEAHLYVASQFGKSQPDSRPACILGMESHYSNTHYILNLILLAGIALVSLADGNFGLVTSVLFPKETKAENFFMDSSGVVHATIVDGDKQLHLYTWKNNVINAKVPAKVVKAPDTSFTASPIAPSWNALMYKGTTASQRC